MSTPLAMSGQMVGEFGQGVLGSPVGVCYHDGKLFVSDARKHGVVVFGTRSRGMFLGRIYRSYACFVTISPSGVVHRRTVVLNRSFLVHSQFQLKLPPNPMAQTAKV